MNAIIIEDEAVACQSLIRQLGEVAPEIKIITTLQSVEGSIEWISSHSEPDIAFIDIHLADGCSFAILEQCRLACPIIFTTAYDQYAIKAFEVNSIGYLLKPIDKVKLRKAIDKINSYNPLLNNSIIQQLLTTLNNGKRDYKLNMLIADRDKLIPISVNAIAYFYIDDRLVFAVLFNGKSHRVDQTLEEIQSELNPDQFFRVNRQYIVQHAAVKELIVWFHAKYILNLTTSTPNQIIIPKTKAPAIKLWLSKGYTV